VTEFSAHVLCDYVREDCLDTYATSRNISQLRVLFSEGMAYNQGFHTQQYPSDQRQGRYQRVQQDGSYHNYGNGAYTNNGGQFEASYGGPNSSSEYRPQPPKAYHRVYPNDGFYRGEIQPGPQDFKRGQAVSEGYGDGYGSTDQGNNHGIGQAVLGDYQSSAEPAYTPGMAIFVFYSHDLPFI
jgi:hypothetical protein